MRGGGCVHIFSLCVHVIAQEHLPANRASPLIDHGGPREKCVKRVAGMNARNVISLSSVGVILSFIGDSF